MKKVLVHLHLFYLNQWSYFAEKLSNIDDCDWDLFVTVCPNEDDYDEYEKFEETQKDILSFKPDAKIITVENAGYDILPFLNVLKSVNLDDYDFVLKLHTKGMRNEVLNFNGIPFCGAFWMKRLVDSMLYSKEIFTQNLKILSREEYGMVVDSFFYINLQNYPEDTTLLDELKKQLNIKSQHRKFLAGSMFFIKASILKRLLNLNISCPGKTATGNIGTIFHAVERVFTILTDDEGYNIYTVPMFY
ncbi:hypothetical protein IJI31_01150 [bacterium]|nr:hypothetical protein [bacterium]